MKRHAVINNETVAGIELCESSKDAYLKSLFFNAKHPQLGSTFIQVEITHQFCCIEGGLSRHYYQTTKDFNKAFKAFKMDATAVRNQESKEYVEWGARMFDLDL